MSNAGTATPLTMEEPSSLQDEDQRDTRAPNTQDHSDRNDTGLQFLDEDAGDAGADRDTVLAALIAAEDGPLTALEECPPHLTGEDFMSALMNTDPRAAFDMVHIGALFAMEAADPALRGCWSSRGIGPDWELPPVSMRRSPYAAPPITAAASGNTRAKKSHKTASSTRVGQCFEVEGIHARIYARPPHEKCERLVDQLQAPDGRAERIQSTLGPDILLALRRNRQHKASRRSSRK